MKLELKHIAPYLPYDLKVISKTETIYYLSTYSNMCGYGIEKREIETVLNNKMKPILHPISDLIKEIQHNGEKFVPINTIKIFTDINHFEYVERFIYDEETLGLLPYWVIELLLEWNFDIFGLIPHGLAIDINTLNK